MVLVGEQVACQALLGSRRSIEPAFLAHPACLQEERKRKRDKEPCDSEGETGDFDPGKKVEVEPPPDRPIRACRTQSGKRGIPKRLWGEVGPVPVPGGGDGVFSTPVAGPKVLAALLPMFFKPQS